MIYAIGRAVVVRARTGAGGLALWLAIGSIIFSVVIGIVIVVVVVSAAMQGISLT